MEPSKTKGISVYKKEGQFGNESHLRNKKSVSEK
jgi:hypothetical protein